MNTTQGLETCKLTRILIPNQELILIKLINSLQKRDTWYGKGYYKPWKYLIKIGNHFNIEIWVSLLRISWNKRTECDLRFWDFEV